MAEVPTFFASRHSKFLRRANPLRFRSRIFRNSFLVIVGDGVVALLDKSGAGVAAWQFIKRIKKWNWRQVNIPRISYLQLRIPHTCMSSFFTHNTAYIVISTFGLGATMPQTETHRPIKIYRLFTSEFKYAPQSLLRKQNLSIWAATSRKYTRTSTHIYFSLLISHLPFYVPFWERMKVWLFLITHATFGNK